jgi:hypothetical protein
MGDSLTGMNPALNAGFFVTTIFGNDEMNRLADGLSRGITEHLFGRVIPGSERPVEILAVDGDLRGADDRRQMRGFLKAPLGQGSPTGILRVSCRPTDAETS